MPAIYRKNRISALLVALLYVYFTTFGAVAHTHATLDLHRSPSATIAAAAHGSLCCGHFLLAAQRDCAACEWQALSVTQNNASPPLVESALICMVPTVPVFSYYRECSARFASRAPPTA